MAPALAAPDPERQAQARVLARWHHLLHLADLVVSAGGLLALVASDLSSRLRDALDLPLPAQAAAYGAVVGAGLAVLGVPLSFVGGYLLPRRFGLLTQGPVGWLADQVKAGAIALVLGLGTLVALYLLLERAPGLWWLYAAGGLLGMSLLLGTLAPVVILPLFFSFRPLGDEQLARRLERLARRAGARVRGTFVMELSRKGTTANAALMGLGRTRRIVIADTLLERCTPEEVEVVLAHELAHHVHRDIPKTVAIRALLTLLTLFLASLVLEAAVDTFDYRGVADVAAFPFLALVLGGLGLLQRVPLNAYSRAVESAADRYALAMTETPSAFVSMLTKLTDQNLSEAEPARWVRLWFSHHPTYRERVAMAHRFAARGWP